MASTFSADNKPISRLLEDGKRLHLNHGPIDLVIEAFGKRTEIEKAYRQAELRFRTLLEELVEELPLLRKPVSNTIPNGLVARTMHAATKAHLPHFITPMAAVAGAGADEILATMQAATRLDKAYVNNGGDIALHPGTGSNFRIGVVANPQTGRIITRADITHQSPIRGIATSGWRGRSQSLGIADSVTVFARTAAIADAAATIIANGVNLAEDHPAINRQPARELAPNSDLGTRLVTTSVGALAASDIKLALDAGEKTAAKMRHDGQIEAAFLSLQGHERITGWLIDRKHILAPHFNQPKQPDRIAHA